MDNSTLPPRGWSWTALVIGPFWYLSHGLTKKGIVLLAIALLSVGLAAPFIWIYCAVRAQSDLYERRLFDKSRFDIDKI
jgi:O-antigen ligase